MRCARTDDVYYLEVTGCEYMIDCAQGLLTLCPYAE
jgi:hypothetical protein